MDCGRRVYDKTYTSLYRGVTREGKNRWRAVVYKKEIGKVNIGTFGTEREAAEAYNQKALEVHGPKAKLNVFESSLENENVRQQKYRPRHIPVPENEFRYFAFALFSLLSDDEGKVQRISEEFEKMVLRIATVSEHVDAKDPHYRVKQLYPLFSKLPSDLQSKFLENVSSAELRGFLESSVGSSSSTDK